MKSGSHVCISNVVKVPSGTKSLPDPELTQDFDAI